MNDEQWAKLGEFEKQGLAAQAVLQAEDHDDRLQLCYSIADIARSIESGGHHWSISESIFDSEIPDEELRTILHDLTRAVRLIDHGSDTVR